MLSYSLPAHMRLITLTVNSTVNMSHE